MKIKLLPDNIINQIAAGEVIEKPSSVVKELVENAIDAQATKIDIILECAGKNLIVVSDNGYGMSYEDMLIAIQRHSTSKLDETDLFNINTFGFRGEALPSIASISKMTITSKTSNSLSAFALNIIGGENINIKKSIYNIGTKIEVRDLFFATPARLKFLRNNNLELYSCINCIKKIALAHPNIEFTLSNDGKSILKIKKSDDMLLRVQDIMGEDFVKNSVMLSSISNNMNITGYTSIPTYNKSTKTEQFLFINNRPVKDNIFNVAIRLAYQDYIPKDRHPSIILFLTINNQLVDVNVHPTKNEVRFFDPNDVRKNIVDAIKSSLRTTNKTSTHISNCAMNLFHSTQKKYHVTEDMINSTLYSKDINNEDVKNNPTIPANTINEIKRDYSHLIFNQNTKKTKPFNTLYNNPFDNLKSKNDIENLSKDTSNNTQIYISNFIEEDTLEKDSAINYNLGIAKAQLFDNYIVSQTHDSFIIIDQHAAHERLTYEKIKDTFNTTGLIKQRLLMPEIIEFNDNSRIEILFLYSKELITFGINIEKFGENSIIVHEIPVILNNSNIQKLIYDITDELIIHETQFTLTEFTEHIIKTYACHHSIRSGRKLSISEMNLLLREIEKIPFSAQCNHGRPTYIKLTLKDIEKLFERS